MTTSTRRLRRTASAFYTAVGALMVVVLALFTITATQTPPPAIAEIAPQAAEQIKEAPESLSSDVGSADGGPGEEGAATTSTTTRTTNPDVAAEVTTTLAPIERARVRRCVGDPPRQTEDPQSPPCVPFWDGDNGGATAQGVTGDEIVVIAPCDGQCPDAQRRVHKAYEEYFNKRFEFYGRRMRIDFATNGNAQCANQKAAATHVDEELKVFAVLDSNAAEDACFHQETARRGVVSVLTNDILAEGEMQRSHPNLWQYSMAYEGLFSAIGEMICARLHTGNAVHSPDPVYQQSPRKFGVILHRAERDGEIPLGRLEQAMAKCGARLEKKIILEFGTVSQDAPTESQRAIAELKSADVTSAICLCWIFREQHLAAAATNNNYFPEWIMSSYGMNDTGHLKTFWTPEQRRSVLGVSSRPPSISQPNDPACNALAEGDPLATCGLDSGGGQPSTNRGGASGGKETLARAWNAYRTLLLLASGIQMAGPNLTPETFAAGLQSTRFPYPPDDPLHSGDVGFLDGDHSMTNTLAEYWWSETTRGPDGTTGAVCYVDNGARRRPGAWPQDDDPFHRGPCDIYGDDP